MMSDLKEQQEVDEMVGEKFLQGHQDAAMFPQGSIADLEESIETVWKAFADVIGSESSCVSSVMKSNKKIDLVLDMLQKLSKNIQRGKKMALVARDEHDEQLKSFIFEIHSIAVLFQSETASNTKQLKHLLSRSKGALSDIKYQINRISDGSIVYTIPSAPSANKLLQYLYKRWLNNRTLIGIHLDVWKKFHEYNRYHARMVKIEKAVWKMQQRARVQQMFFFNLWMEVLDSKQRLGICKQRVSAKSQRTWMMEFLRNWKSLTFRNRRTERFISRQQRYGLGMMMKRWMHFKLQVRRRRKISAVLSTEMQSRYQLISFQFWRSGIVWKNKWRRLNVARMQHSQAQSCLFQHLLHWFAIKRIRIKVRSRSKMLQRRDAGLVFDCWRTHVSRMKSLAKRKMNVIIRRQWNQQASCLQVWCSYVYMQETRKIVLVKMQRCSNVISMQSILKYWSYTAKIVLESKNLYKLRRTFQRLKKAQILRNLYSRIKESWDSVNNLQMLKQYFNRWQIFFDCILAAYHQLRKTAMENGRLELSAVFSEWRQHVAVTISLRWKGERIADRNSLYKLLAHLLAWNSQQHGSKSRSSVRHYSTFLTKTRRHNLKQYYLRTMYSYLTGVKYIAAKLEQVDRRLRHRRTKQFYQMWRGLIPKRRAVLSLTRKFLRNFMHLWLHYFRHSVNMKVCRMVYGAWCPECKQPLRGVETKVDLAVARKLRELAGREAEEGGSLLDLMETRASSIAHGDMSEAPLEEPADFQLHEPQDERKTPRASKRSPKTRRMRSLRVVIPSAEESMYQEVNEALISAHEELGRYSFLREELNKVKDQQQPRWLPPSPPLGLNSASFSKLSPSSLSSLISSPLAKRRKRKLIVIVQQNVS
uniref:Sfi1 spindle body domain-containing protein n=2 Tax=Guillardia theta TaxID=55529 RepID=A0A6U6CR77_GUITH|mmetsp:Transcript_48417/g.151831  ORF Transcript_48417/g.151831 Transcript_48417/m.151831 type:complete len:871 (+) Transcript_48417:264-2876(+)